MRTAFARRLTLANANAVRNNIAVPHSRHGSLNQEAIVSAARAIADAEGLNSVTLRRVAEALDTGAASIYRHVSGRAELLALVVEDLAVGFPLLRPAETPEQTIRRQWLAIHDHLVRHPWAAQVIASGETTSVSGEQLTKHTVGQFTALGLPNRDAARAYRTLWNLLIGHLLNEHPLGHGQLNASRSDRRADLGWAVQRFVAGCRDACR